MKMASSPLVGSLHDTFSIRLVYEHAPCHSEATERPKNLRFYVSTIFRLRKAARQYPDWRVSSLLWERIEVRGITPSLTLPLSRGRGYVESSPSVAFRIISAKQVLLTLMRLLRAGGPRNDSRKTLPASRTGGL